MQDDGFEDWQVHLGTDTRTGSELSRHLPEVAVPALTVLAHPDPGRIGDVAVLPELARGKTARLSRLEPAFAEPAGGEGRPLADPRLSRQAIRLEPVPDGGLAIDTSETKTRVEAGGVCVAERHEIPGDAIEEGVVMLLGDRVALLLHRMVPVTQRPPGFGLVGESASLLRLRREIARLADLELSVLLRGESGTGKELVAAAIQAHGRRRNRPFVKVNMGAVPPTLAAAELFGAARGAYSGADRARRGYFQRADGGTLFLDEIGETPLAVQALLLRVLETGEVQPVGAGAPQKVDVRLIAATDSDLEAACASARFRAPLLHRLGGYEICVPPLRGRREDVGRLFYHFLRQELEAFGEPERLVSRGPHARSWVSAEFVARLAGYDWPGNVRQLRNAVRQIAVANRDRGEMQVPERVESLLAAGGGKKEKRPAAVPPPRRRAPRAAYRDPGDVGEEELLAALRAYRFELKPAAAALRISRASLYTLIDRSPSVRKASELSRAEIERCAESCGGKPEAMAEALEVSKQGLKRRMKELGLR